MKADPLYVVLGSMLGTRCEGCGNEVDEPVRMVAVAHLDEDGMIRSMRAMSAACYAEEVGTSVATVRTLVELHDRHRAASIARAREVFGKPKGEPKGEPMDA